MRLTFLAFGLAVSTLAGPMVGNAQSGSTALVSIQVESGIINRDACRLTVEDTVPADLRTDQIAIEVINSASNTRIPAPFDLIISIGQHDSVSLRAQRDSTGIFPLIRSSLRGSTILVRESGQKVPVCALTVPPHNTREERDTEEKKDDEDEEDEEEEGTLEVDPAFQLLAGVEFLSVDGFRSREAHIPAAAVWTIPVRVNLLDTVRVNLPDSSRTWRDSTKIRIRRGNVYSLLRTSAEFTRLLSKETTFTCTGTTFPNGATPPSGDAGSCGSDEVGPDSTTAFREEFQSEDWSTVSAWRIYSNFRWEWNPQLADFDVFVGPAVTLGFQTDPGIGSPDFFPIFTAGVSLTQVEITEEYYEERLQLQVGWGKFPNYSEDVVTQLDSSTVRRFVSVPSTARWHVYLAFQPITGYFIRGSAEFGHGVPDVARIGIVARLDLEKLIGGILGEKEPTGP